MELNVIWKAHYGIPKTDTLNERSSHLMMKLVMEKNERMDIEIIKQFQKIFDQCMKII